MDPDFGDADPEDAWDADDPLPILIDNLDRRLRLLAALAVLRGPHKLRLELIRRDLAWIGQRIEAGD